MMGRRLRILVWSVALVATIVAALLITAGPATAKQFATLDVLGGTVDVRAAGAEAFHAGAHGDTLRVGDIVRTASDGRAEIEYFDGSVTRLDFDTEFTLEELTSQGSSKDIVGTQSGGNTFNRVTHLTDSQSRFEVDTPTATASVKGTAFAVRVDELGTSDIWVVEGVVMAVLDDGMRVKVHSGRGITIDPDGTSDGVYVLTDAQLGEDWLEFNLCTLDGQLDACGEGVLGVEIMNPGTPPEEMPAGGNVVLGGPPEGTGGPKETSKSPAPRQDDEPGEEPPPPEPPPSDPPKSGHEHGCVVSIANGQGSQNPSCGPEGPGRSNENGDPGGA